MDLLLLGPSVNLGASVLSVHQVCPVVAWQSPYLLHMDPYMDLLVYHLQMPGSLYIPTLHLRSPGCQFTPFENIHL